jgi:energy-coupling factor transporter ATP-binding protein EcfA2
MQRVTVNLQNCYGIKKLEYAFNFSDKKTYSIYSPNGIMKTSFAKTFQDLTNDKDSKDLMFPDRKTVRQIQDENGNDLKKEQVFVIEPYNEQFDSEKKSSLLVNKGLKNQYDYIHKKINAEKDELTKKLKQLSGLSGRNNNIENEISKSFENKDFFNIIQDLSERVFDKEDANFASIIYDEIFNDTVLSFLNTSDFKKQIKEYIEKLNSLLDSSTYLKREFNHYHAATVNKNLIDNGFFKAKHSVNLFNGKSKEEINEGKEFEEIIKKEKEKVLNNADLQKKFEAIDKKLSNAQLRQFREYLLENKNILLELEDLNKFRQDIWVSYFKDQKDLYKNLLDQYAAGKQRIAQIVKQAKQEKTAWKAVIDIFNKRFSVPFILSIKNQDDVILKSNAPAVEFLFKDSEGEKIIEKQELLQVLSQGEKRALYILNIIFEVEARKKANQNTLFIVDDIADSFDYKNKYAIIEYLKEISEKDIFCQIILTHNYDFHRTVCGRLNMKRESKLNTICNEGKIQIIEEKYQKNPFSHWKNNLSTKEMLIASIPFVRNLAEYCGYDVEFKKLTSLLHMKQDTNTLKVADLETIFKDILKDKNNLVLVGQTEKVVDIIFRLADNIEQDSSDIVELENKIVLSIAIRLKAEAYMINKINDSIFVNGIGENQTFELIKKFKTEFSGNVEEIKLLEQVNLMTPENIHLNSFMYEPILDMSNVHLKRLYSDIKRSSNLSIETQ